MKPLMHHIHPDSSCWRLELLNERSEDLFIEKVYDEDEGVFSLRFGIRTTEWVEPKRGEPKILLSDVEFIAWTFDYQEDVEAMIKMLEKMKNEIPKLKDISNEHKLDSKNKAQKD